MSTQTVTRREENVRCMLCNMGNCGLIATIENGKVVEFRGDPDWPLTQGAVCPKTEGLLEWNYHPERLRAPLKRVGERGEGKWQEIPWEQALDEIAEKLGNVCKEYGPEAVHFDYGNSLSWNMIDMWRFHNLLGSPNCGCAGSTHCGAPQENYNLAMAGWGHPCAGWLVPGKTKAVLIWGAKPSDSLILGVNAWPTIRACQERGAKLITIDPRYTVEAQNSDLWLQIRPGTDGALAMAMINHIIQNELYDKEFVEAWCTGLDKLAAKVKPMTLEKAEEITWVPADKIRQAAEIYAANRPAVSYWGVALSQFGRATSSAACYVDELRYLTGNIGREGSQILTDPREVPMDIYGDLGKGEMLPESQRKKIVGGDRYKLNAFPGEPFMYEYQKPKLGQGYLEVNYCQEPTSSARDRRWRTNKPYPLKAYIVAGADPFFGHENIREGIYQAMKYGDLDLAVHVDLFMTPFGEFCDYVIPTDTTFEKPAFNVVSTMTGNLMSGSPKIVDLPPENKGDYAFFSGLGRRLGQGKYWPEKAEDWYDEILKPFGTNWQDFSTGKDGNGAIIAWPLEDEIWKKPQKDGSPLGFATPSGKLELYPTVIEKKMGWKDALPDYEEPPESYVARPDLAAEYPLILITGPRPRHFFFSLLRNVKSLREKHPWPLVEIHPETAIPLGIAEGDWVYIETPKGRIRQKAHLVTSIHPRCVSADFDWWYPEEPGEEPFTFGAFTSNAQVLTDDDPDMIDQRLGSEYMRGQPCRIYKATKIV
mgnify:CR=1 FL=1